MLSAPLALTFPLRAPSVEESEQTPGEETSAEDCHAPSDFGESVRLVPDARIQLLRLESEKLFQMEEAVRRQRAHVIGLSNAYRECVAYHEGNKENVLAETAAAIGAEGRSAEEEEMMDGCEKEAESCLDSKTDASEKILNNIFPGKMSSKP